MATGSWLVVVLLAAGPVTARVPIGASGEIDAAEVVARLATEAGLDVARPTESLRLPARGVAGGLARTILGESLGPDVTLEFGAKELVVTWKGGDPSRLRPRIEALARAVDEEARRRLRYGMHARPSYRPNDPTRPTICLVHGMNSSSYGFVHMVAPLEEAGFGLVFYDYPFNRDLDQTSPAFARDWAAFRKERREKRPWVVLTHSMGALLARDYVEGDGFAGDVSDLILIAPPNRGSAIAGAQTILQLIQGVKSVQRKQAGALARLSEGLGAAADDLTPGSAFLKRLDRRSRRAGVRYHILAGDDGFLTREARDRIEGQTALMTRSGGLIGGLTRLAAGDLSGRLDELTDGDGDGCVALSSTKLDGVNDREVIHSNHVALIRGPMLYPDPGPVDCMPFVLKRLEAVKPARR
ncbi:MAG TPA: alpha/beta fold hydrolase [Isosphaeraceae bacterium]|jgi:pimeloyl-ACP methyl ester carboxylesterase|nr:alpha/beta fold hydrolase [Isosphaeraceae bacterium]